MNRVSQNLVLMLLGGAILRISAFSTTYVNYVKPGFRPFLIAAGAALLLLGIVSWRRMPEHEHPGPRVAWLLCLPVLAIFLIAPPALGSFAASRSDAAPPPPVQTGYQPLEGATAMPMGEFIGRAWGEGQTLKGHVITLTGFVTPSKKKDQWYVTRMQLSCCAADAYALKVAVRGAAEPEENTWVEVTGTWVPHVGKVPNGVVWAELEASSVEKVDEPAEPYE
ncbi:TIGR03943 family putative permease subunit [Nonomuraea sp. NPDC050556]|uniref:TIGR03943 family putative permease subunit n=1 Tax=Nonomuraea sp. NPDC050556 TaxID=3364369 RepID=UPI003799DFE6